MVLRRSPSLQDILRVVLPCVFPDFQETGPCSEWAAILLGAPVHGGIACALCHQQNIVGPRFEGGEGQSLCGRCFVKETVKGKADDSSDLAGDLLTWKRCFHVALGFRIYRDVPIPSHT